MPKPEKSNLPIIEILIAILAFMALERLFRDNNSTVVSSIGDDVLKDHDLMLKIQKELDAAKSDKLESPNKIVVDL